MVPLASRPPVLSIRGTRLPTEVVLRLPCAPSFPRGQANAESSILGENASRPPAGWLSGALPAACAAAAAFAAAGGSLAAPGCRRPGASVSPAARRAGRSAAARARTRVSLRVERLGRTVDRKTPNQKSRSQETWDDDERWQGHRMKPTPHWNGSAETKVFTRPETAIATPYNTPQRRGGPQWPEVFERCRDFVDDYDAFVIDLRSIVRNGRLEHEGAVECLREMHKSGKPVVLMSNCPARAHVQRDMLPGLGLDPSWFAGVVTSGELTHKFLRRQTKYGKRCMWLSTTRVPGLEDFFSDLEGYTLTDNPKEADFVLSSGGQLLYAGTESEEEIRFEVEGDGKIVAKALRAAAHKRIPMICANPDIKIETPGDRGQYEYMAGALAEEYLGWHGHVQYFGTPYTAAFEEAKDKVWEAVEENNPDVEEEDLRICHFGGNLRFDVEGAATVGMASALLVQGGVFADRFKDKEPTPLAIKRLCYKERLANPDIIMQSLVW